MRERDEGIRKEEMTGEQGTNKAGKVAPSIGCD